MTKRIATKGQCESCKIVVAKQFATKHCQKCFPLSSSTKSNPFFLIKVTSDSPLYWLYLSAPAKCSLADLDDFLKSIWLECCGHLSCFNINGILYDSNPEIDTEHLYDMDIKLGSILAKGMQFDYEYDFGSTTKLKLEVLDMYQDIASTKIRLLMRNIAPGLACFVCQKLANYICSMCNETLCKTHLKHKVEYGCNKDYCLELVNSPRTGVCGYQ